jgi:hypothetical protein
MHGTTLSEVVLHMGTRLRHLVLRETNVRRVQQVTQGLHKAHIGGQQFVDGGANVLGVSGTGVTGY